MKVVDDNTDISIRSGIRLSELNIVRQSRQEFESAVVAQPSHRGKRAEGVLCLIAGYLISGDETGRRTMSVRVM